MKKSYILVAVVALSFAAMSFNPKPVEVENLATKISTTNLNQKLTAKSGKLAIVPLAVVAVALAETSYAATVVATAAAYHWLFGNSADLVTLGNSKTIMQDIDMHNLDNGSK